MVDEEFNILKKIGLTYQESKVYVSLLELGEAQTGALCIKTKIASSNIYKILETLKNKGLVSTRIKNNIKIFIPSSPEAIYEIFLDKEREIENQRSEIKEIIYKLKNVTAKKEINSNYKYFEGLSGIKSMWLEINNKMSPNYIIKIHTARKESYEKFIDFYNIHHKLRKQKKIKELMIFPKEDTDLAKKRVDEFTKIKFMELKNDAEWGVFNDVFFIQYIVNKNPKGFLIKDDIFAKTMEQNFDKLWSISK